MRLRQLLETNKSKSNILPGTAVSHDGETYIWRGDFWIDSATKTPVGFQLNQTLTAKAGSTPKTPQGNQKKPANTKAVPPPPKYQGGDFDKFYKDYISYLKKHQPELAKAYIQNERTVKRKALNTLQSVKIFKWIKRIGLATLATTAATAIHDATELYSAHLARLTIMMNDPYSTRSISTAQILQYQTTVTYDWIKTVAAQLVYAMVAIFASSFFLKRLGILRMLSSTIGGIVGFLISSAVYIGAAKLQDTLVEWIKEDLFGIISNSLTNDLAKNVFPEISAYVQSNVEYGQARAIHKVAQTLERLPWPEYNLQLPTKNPAVMAAARGEMDKLPEEQKQEVQAMFDIIDKKYEDLIQK